MIADNVHLAHDLFRSTTIFLGAVGLVECVFLASHCFRIARPPHYSMWWALATFAATLMFLMAANYLARDQPILPVRTGGSLVLVILIDVTTIGLLRFSRTAARKE